MRNLIQFLSKNTIVFIFLFLELIAFSLLVSNNSYQSSKVFNSSSYLVGNLYATTNNIENYFNLKDINTELAEQNATLQNNNISSFTKVFGKTVEINDTVYAQKYFFIAAKVINSSTNKRENYITLDKGGIVGIKAGMGVISSKGIIGTVKNVSKNFSSVMSVLHEKNAVSVKIKKSGYIGSLSWELGDYQTGQLKDIPNHVSINKGDTIITSGFSLIYPEGIVVGWIKDFDLPKGNNFYNIDIGFTTDYKKLSHVFIVKSWMKEEQQELEKESLEND